MKQVRACITHGWRLHVELTWMRFRGVDEKKCKEGDESEIESQENE